MMRTLWSRRNICRSLNDTYRGLSTSLKKIDDKDQFLFGDEKKSFNDLGLSESLTFALKASKKNHPTLIQTAALAPILNGKDVVIGAETGSGKTLAFMIPLFQRILDGTIVRESAKYPATYVLVPSKELCHQAHVMANSVLNHLRYTSEIVPTCEAITLADGNWPYKGKDDTSPDIIICTPAFLGSYLRGPHILDNQLFNSIQIMVLDEADMLLDGSYKKDIKKIMDALKVVRRNKINDGLLKVHERSVQFILSAATIPTHGKLSVERTIKSYFPKALDIRNSHFHRHHPRISQTFVELPEEVIEEESEENPISPIRVDAIITALKSRGELSSTQRKISFAEFSGEQIDHTQEQSFESTMIFLNTAENAQIFAAALRERNISCEEFHKLVPHDLRMTGFRNFADGKSSILVCTDAAARGFDLPNVKHIIQAEFALNVVHHLHRIGRASRAGVSGRATNFIDKCSKELVDSILSDQWNDSIDQSFSRRRGFRRNLKRKQQSSMEKVTEESSL